MSGNPIMATRVIPPAAIDRHKNARNRIALKFMNANFVVNLKHQLI